MNFKHTKLPIELEYPKLVRDKIPEIIKKNDGLDIAQCVLSDDDEFFNYLCKKITEEAMELQYSLKEGNEKEELADIFEIIDAILSLRKLTAKDIMDIQKIKKEKRGGFAKRILMLSK